MEKLIEAIKQVGELAEECIRDKEGEANTRSYLVNPILRSLGWNPEVRHLVKHEDPINKVGRADYSLWIDGSPVIYIEVKRVSHSLEEALSQAMTYADRNRIKLFILTNGIRWVVYFKQVYYEMLFDLDIERLSPELTASKLSILQYIQPSQELLSKVRQVWLDKQIHTRISSQLENPSKDFILALVPKEDRTKLLIEESIKNDEIRESIQRFQIPESCVEAKGKTPTYSNINPAITKSGKNTEGATLITQPSPPQRNTPQTVTASGGKYLVIAGEIIPINKAYDIIINTAEWLITRKMIISTSSPIRLQRSILLSLDENDFGNNTSERHVLSNGMQIKKYWGLAEAEEKATFLFQQFMGLDTQFEIHWQDK